MAAFYSWLARAYFVAATVTLMLLAFAILGIAIWEVAVGLFTETHVQSALNGVSLLVIGFAVIETAKFIAEEEVLRKRELRSSTESRQSITKFVTIIVIAACLEALVMVFQATRHDITAAISSSSNMQARFILLPWGSISPCRAGSRNRTAAYCEKATTSTRKADCGRRASGGG